MRKYGSKKVMYDGIVFDSEKEMRRYSELKNKPKSIKKNRRRNKNEISFN